MQAIFFARLNCRMNFSSIKSAVRSCVRGYHVYGEDWIAVLGEYLSCEREIGNVVNRYAVAIINLKKDSGETVGHVPKISCSSFLQQGYAL